MCCQTCGDSSLKCGHEQPDYLTAELRSAVEAVIDSIILENLKVPSFTLRMIKKLKEVYDSEFYA